MLGLFFFSGVEDLSKHYNNIQLKGQTFIPVTWDDKRSSEVFDLLLVPPQRCFPLAQQQKATTLLNPEKIPAGLCLTVTSRNPKHHQSDVSDILSGLLPLIVNTLKPGGVCLDWRCSD